MSTQTTNLQLIKPDADDHYDVNVQNENMDKIDEVIHSHITNQSNPHRVTPSQIGAKYADLQMLGPEIPVDWASFWALGSGAYSWVQGDPLDWQPDDTPSGALRVVLFIDMHNGQSYALRLLYVDGATNGVEYIGENDGAGGGRWVRVYNTRHKPTAADVGAVRLGGGVGQNNNTVHIGWNGTDLKLKATVDNMDLGSFVLTGGADQAILPVGKGGTGATNATDARMNLGAAPAYTYGTTDLIAGTSSLETGKIYLVYE